MVAVIAEPEELTVPRLHGLTAVADALEVRADLVGDPDPYLLRRYFKGPLVYGLRSSRHGGGSRAGPIERRTRLLRAAAHYDLVDLEAMDDLLPEMLARIPARQRRISWHSPEPGRPGPCVDDDPLEAARALWWRFVVMAATPAALYLIESSAACHGSASPQLLTGVKRADVTAFASGPAGTWTRVLAPWLGAPVVFGRVGAPGADGMPSIGQLLADYGLPALPPLRFLLGIAGSAPGRSLSPRLHNAALRHLRLPALYLPFQVDSLPRFWQWATGLGAPAALPLRGLTVTAPHKQNAVDVADVADREALRSGAANLLWYDGERWRAATTDPFAALSALDLAGVDPGGRSAAVIGCGGAGRAVASALRGAGGRVTLVNRGEVNGREASARLRLPYVPLSRFSPAGHTLLVHATPLVEQEPFPVADVEPDAVVMEMAYRDRPTALMSAVRARGLLGIDGWDILFAEVREQFRLLTGHPMPEELPLRSLCPGPHPPDVLALTSPAPQPARPSSGEAP
ncbi:hypothetical protein BIV24_06810 [Streptomyces colonosanans]|uniref:Shikimate dehydrogenase substrate binding N-terminal domain-containing protein n=1 Tax=Streptomyces colonosanans TaxID=1428652 RepID=A0A1S2PV55_9ACTN|nr:hypothetical protein BIV24_06810 [Streptomyces colonosanans]